MFSRDLARNVCLSLARAITAGSWLCGFVELLRVLGAGLPQADQKTWRYAVGSRRNCRHFALGLGIYAIDRCDPEIARSARIEDRGRRAFKAWESCVMGDGA